MVGFYRKKESHHISLLNPLTRVQIHLPPVTTFTGIMDFQISKTGDEYLCCSPSGHMYTYSAEHLAKFYMQKVVLSKNPTVDNYIAMLICREVSKLAFCRSVDDKWTVIEIEDARNHTAYVDIIYFKGQFYALNCMGRVVVCNITGPSPKTRNIKPPVNLCHDEDNKYLVDLSGELLLVFKHIEVYEDGKGPDFYETLFFKVFKLNHNGRKWVELKSLGDSSLFLGVNSSLSLCAKDFPACKANCIYFTDDYLYYTESCPGGHDSGIFNLEDGSIESFPCYLDKSILNHHKPPIWVTPSLY